MPEAFYGEGRERIVAVIGCKRVGAGAQDAQLQEGALGAAGCSKAYEGKASGKNAERPGLSLLSTV